MNECNSVECNSAELTYYQWNRGVILNRAKDYENDTERLRRHARDKYINLSEEEKKNKKREYGKNRYHNMSEEKKTKAKRISKKLSQG